MGADFSELKSLLTGEVRERYDHAHLNETPPFNTVTPTAENLARECFSRLRARTASMPGGRLERVEIWEGPENYVAYEE